MGINWIGYQYSETDGYGRYGSRMVQALQGRGVAVHALLNRQADMPWWMTRQLQIDWSRLNISCLPPLYLQPLPKLAGPHWLYTMTEGSELPDGWAEIIMECGVERVIVPCEANRQTFAAALDHVVGTQHHIPVDVIHGGTCPDEFPFVERDVTELMSRPYTFLALADRGARKGWNEVWSAFYRAFGSPEDTPNVRLIVKALPGGNEVLERIAGAADLDPRVDIRIAEANMADLYAEADCFAIPSRFEGWGMPHREAAMMGTPVITQRYSGMDDGYTDRWALVAEPGVIGRIPRHFDLVAGEWRIADVDTLAQIMTWCYRYPERAIRAGAKAAGWLRLHQTWDHAARRLMNLIEEHAPYG